MIVFGHRNNPVCLPVKSRQQDKDQCQPFEMRLPCWDRGRIDVQPNGPALKLCVLCIFLLLFDSVPLHPFV